MAQEFGRDVLDVARQSFALTLYTSWHLQQWQRHDIFEREAMQHSLASLIAYAMHDPKELSKLHDRFVAQNRQRSPIEIVDARARVHDLVSAHQRLVPLE